MELQYETHQLHFISNNLDIEATPPFVTSISNLLDKYALVPVTSKEFNPVTATQREFLTLASTNTKFRIEFLSGSLIIVADCMTQDEFKMLSFEIIDHLVTLFPDKTANRLSVLNTKIFNDTPDVYNRIYNRLFTHRDISPFEWDNRIVERRVLDISKEDINSISVIRRLEVASEKINSNKPIDVITFDVDSNTVFQNGEFRFTLRESMEILSELFENNRKISNDLSRYY